MDITRLENCVIKDKRVLIRMDLNVPISGNAITSTTRIDAVLDSLQHVVRQGARTMLMSHLGRPVEGEYDAQYSLQPVADYLSSRLGFRVPLIRDYLDQEVAVDSGQVVLLENVRFNVGEASNCADLSQQYARLCDVFVMDSFGTAHRAQASTYGVGQHAPSVCCGALLASELDALERSLASPKPPTVAIVGGAKVSTKINVFTNLLDKVDCVIPGGGIANNFIAALGHNVGKSLYESDQLSYTQQLIRLVQEKNKQVIIPIDVVTGKAFSAESKAEIKMVDAVDDDDMIFDVGPQTIELYKEIMAAAGTVLWNGPVGVFEFDQFSMGTKELGCAIASSDSFSIAGGGDTLAAIEKFNLVDDISYISTGGGAFLEFLEGKKLPAIEMLETRMQG